MHARHDLRPDAAWPRREAPIPAASTADAVAGLLIGLAVLACILVATLAVAAMHTTGVAEPAGTPPRVAPAPAGAPAQWRSPASSQPVDQG